MFGYDYRTKDALKSVIFEQLGKLGGDFIEASYSGGNDEGGVDDICIYKGTGDGRIVIAPGAFSYDHPLWEAIDELLSHDFGTWAGDFSAEGTVCADLREQRIWREGAMSTYTSDESAGEY